MPDITAEEYMQNLYLACRKHNPREGYLAGPTGALNLARDFGYGLADYPQAEREHVLKSSYSYLCVRIYNLHPPVDAKEWNGAIREGIRRRNEYVGI